MLLLTVQVHGNLVQIKVLEIEGIPLPIAVVCAIVDHFDRDSRGQLTGKQFLVTDIEIILRNREGLAHHAAYGILYRAAFQSLGVSEEHGGHQFHFAHKHRCLHDLHFTVHRPLQTEIVSAASQIDLYADLVDHVAILEKDVGMQTSHHVERATLQSQRATL